MVQEPDIILGLPGQWPTSWRGSCFISCVNSPRSRAGIHSAAMPSRLRHAPCRFYEAGEPFYNPYGMWMLE